MAALATSSFHILSIRLNSCSSVNELYSLTSFRVISWKLLFCLMQTVAAEAHYSRLSQSRTVYRSRPCVASSTGVDGRISPDGRIAQYLSDNPYLKNMTWSPATVDDCNPTTTTSAVDGDVVAKGPQHQNRRRTSKKSHKVKVNSLIVIVCSFNVSVGQASSQLLNTILYDCMVKLIETLLSSL